MTSVPKLFHEKNVHSYKKSIRKMNHFYSWKSLVFLPEVLILLSFPMLFPSIFFLLLYIELLLKYILFFLLLSFLLLKKKSQRSTQERSSRISRKERRERWNNTLFFCRFWYSLSVGYWLLLEKSIASLCFFCIFSF